VDLHEWLLAESKSINDSIHGLVEGTRDYFADLHFDFLFEFFQKCCCILEQNCKYLSQAIAETINRKIDVTRPLFAAPAPPSVLGTSEPGEPREERMRCSKQISRELEGLDYFLSLLAYEDGKSYEEYKSQCDKLLLQRQLLEGIGPSGASRQIMETANMIDNAIESSDRVFQDSYLLKYAEFKSFVNELVRPEEIGELYREEMESATRQKFKDGMNRTLKKCFAINQREGQKSRTAAGTQTEEVKGIKYQEKLQNLLVSEKKNNEKLSN
jgi:hypothetical protein